MSKEERKKINLLFVCSANVNRSQAFAREMKKLVKKIDNVDFEIRSAGLYAYTGDGYQLDPKILGWADKVFVMAMMHKIFVHKKYPEFLSKVEVIGVSDEYDVDSPAIVEVIQYWYHYHFLEWLSRDVLTAGLGLRRKG